MSLSRVYMDEAPPRGERGKLMQDPATAPLRARIAELFEQGMTDAEIGAIVLRDPEAVRWHRKKMGLANRGWTPDRRAAQAERSRRQNEACKAAEADDANSWPKIDPAAVRRMVVNFGRKLWADDPRAARPDYGRLPPRETAGRVGCASAMCADAGHRATGAWA